WGDPSVTLDPVQGLPPLRRDWILKRGDVDEIEGRVVRPIDDGYLSDKHSAIAAKRRSTFNGAGAPSRRKPLRASASHPVTQLWYARQGIITPEMEFIAIRENLGRERQKEELKIKKGNGSDPELLNSSFLLHTSDRNSLA